VTTALLFALLSGAPLPDLQPPLGKLSQVVALPEGGVPHGEKVVTFKLDGCEREVAVNATKVAAGAAYALQQLHEWLQKTPGLEASLFKPGTLGDVSVNVTRSAAAPSRPCKGSGQGTGPAPKLCPGGDPTAVWFVNGQRVAAVVRWAESEGVDKCLPKVSALLFDSKGQARLSYTADLGGAVSAVIHGDRCQAVQLTYDGPNEVFHAARRSCKGL
jgi:hypothetical protein